jgi:protein SCO1/2
MQRREVRGPVRTFMAAALLAVSNAGCAGGGHGRPSPKGISDAAAVQAEAAALHGGVLQPALPEPAMRLTDTAGGSYRLVARNRDKVTLLYFGYTHCPDVCPTTMADIATALRQSTPAVRRAVTVVFVTVDPRRDSRAVLRRWLDDFDPSFVGLRGPLHEIVADERAVDLPVSKVSHSGKTVEHSAEVLAFTPDRLAHVLYTEGPTTISDLRHDLPILVREHAFA